MKNDNELLSFDYSSILKLEEIDYWIGNPAVELISGSLIFRESPDFPTSTSFSSILDILNNRKLISNVLLVLPIPIQKNFFEFVDFIQESQNEILEMRILKTSLSKAYGILLCFDGEEGAEKFYRSFLGKRFNSLEEEICLLKEVINIKFTYERTKNSIFSTKQQKIHDVLENFDPLGLFVLNLNQNYSDAKLVKKKTNEQIEEDHSPYCPICFEELESVAIIRERKFENKSKVEKSESLAVLGILCGHFFHSKCLKNWTDSTCPLCRYHQQPPETSYCEICGSSNDLWMCLICGFIGCGLENKMFSHNVEHYQKTQHIFCIEIESKLVFDHSKESYVHRLLQNSVDGKIMEMNGNGKKGINKKIENIILDFNLIMNSQYDTQRTYYEEEIKRMQVSIENSKKEKLVGIINLKQEISKETNKNEQVLKDLKKNELEHDELKNEYTKILKKLSDLNKENTTLSKQLEEKDKIMNSKISETLKEIENLKSQISDLESHLNAKSRLSSQMNEKDIETSHKNPFTASMIIPIENKEEKTSNDIDNDINGLVNEEPPVLTAKELQEQEKEKKRLEKKALARKKFREKFKKKEAKRLEQEKKLKEKEALDAEKRKFLFTEQDKLSRLEKYDEEDKIDQDNLVFIADEQFKGPTPYRKVTDKFWIYFFVFLNFGLAATSYFAMVDGDMNRLINGMDFRGVICGVDKYSDKPYLYFVNPVLDINVAICVKSCPQSTGNKICLYEKDGFTKTGFCYTQMQTSYSGKYCLPLEPVNRLIVDDFLNEVFNLVKRTSADFYLAKEFIAIGIAFSVFLSALIFSLLKHQKFVACVSWMSIFGSFAVIGGFAYLFYTEYQTQIARACPFTETNMCTGWKTNFFYYFFILMCVIGGIYLIIILKLFGRIQLAIGILKAASQTTEVLSQLKIIPVVMTILGLGFCALTILVSMKSFSCGEIEVISANNIDGSKVKKIQWNSYFQWIIIYNIFMLSYWLLIILGYSDLITSYALCIWFFVKNKETVDIPVKRSFRDISLYHLGTLFFGSLALVILGLPKMLFGILTRVLKKAKQHSDFVRFWSASCMCCIHVYQKLFRYISMNAYVQASLWGDNYYHSAKKAYFLLFRHQNVMKDLDFLQSFLILQTKLCVSLGAAIAIYLLIKFFDKTFILNESLENLESPFASTILVFFVAYFLSTIIQGSLNITCKTIIQCYLIDSEMFIGEQRYAEEFIRKFMDFFSKNSNKKIWVQLDIEKLEPTNPKEEENDSENDELNKTNQGSIKPDNPNEDENEEQSEEESEESAGDSQQSEGSKEQSDFSENEQAPKSDRFVHDASEENVDFFGTGVDNNGEIISKKELEGDVNENNENSTNNNSRLFKKKAQNQDFLTPKNEDWDVNNASYDEIKKNVFNVLDQSDEKQRDYIEKGSLNLFDKSRLSDSTWKFEDPFETSKRSYRL